LAAPAYFELVAKLLSRRGHDKCLPQIIQAVAKILAKEFGIVAFARDGEEPLKAVIRLKGEVAVMDT
jgi:hypothetical protein